MDSTQNPTAVKCSQPPQQSNRSSRICYQTPTPQTVHNLPSFQGTAEFSTKTYLWKLFTTPTFSQSPAGSSTTPCPSSSTQPTQTKPYPTSCFQPPQKPKVMTEQHIRPAVQAVKVVRSSLNQHCLDFSEANRGKQCTSISLTFLPVMPLFVKQRFLKKYWCSFERRR